MNLVVVDLEWNQSSTGREPEVAKLPFEIIEIGAIKLNDSYEMYIPGFITSPVR